LGELLDEALPITQVAADGTDGTDQQIEKKEGKQRPEPGGLVKKLETPHVRLDNRTGDRDKRHAEQQGNGQLDRTEKTPNDQEGTFRKSD